jgi:ribonuclease BN (tRNA processing enzyme)
VLKQLLILGCGHSESLVHFNNNAAILAPKGNMLIDGGHTIKHALHQQNMSIADVDAIFITHVHGDHVFGLERIAYEAKFIHNKRITLIFHESIFQELWHETLKGSLGKIGEGEAQFSDYFDLNILKGDSFTIFDTKYQLVPVKHTPNKSTFGLLIDDKVFYSSDTTAIKDTIKNLSFDIGFHDVTLSEFNPVHATLGSLIEQYPNDIKQKMFLMSYEDSFEQYQETVNQEFKGFAYQGQRINF